MDPTTITLLVTTGSSLLLNVATLLHQMKVHSSLCFGAFEFDADVENKENRENNDNKGNTTQKSLMTRYQS
jgi:hypothetical protein